MCIKGKRIKNIYIGERFWEERNLKKKKKRSNSKKSGEAHTCLGWRGNQERLLGWRKKKMETNEYMVDKRMKK